MITNGTWSLDDGVFLKCGDKVVAHVYFGSTGSSLGEIEDRTKLFELVCKTMNKAAEQEKASKEPLFGNDGLLWPATFDADVWAEEFCKQNTASDKDMMRAWLANAIMRGYDTANQKNEKDRQEKAKQGIVNAMDGLISDMSCIPKLHLEKVVVDGKEKFKLVDFENILCKNQLPPEYTESAPHFYFDAQMNNIVMAFKSKVDRSTDFSLRFNLGRLIDLEYINDFRACYERLSRIKEKMKAVKPERLIVTL